MHFHQGTVVPISLCYQAYALLILLGCVGAISAFSVALLTIYGVGGVEMALAMSFVGFFGLVRILSRPWSTADDTLYFAHRAKNLDSLAVDTFALEEPKEEILMPSRSYCPICLELFETGEEVSTASEWIGLRRLAVACCLMFDEKKHLGFTLHIQHSHLRLDLISLPSPPLLVLGVCHHTYHMQCLQMWVTKSATCPCCRQDLEVRTTDSIQLVW